MKPINVGLLGLGTVGGGTLTVLRRNAEEITRRAGREIRVLRAAVRNLDKAKQIAGDLPLSTNPFDVVDDPEIDIVVELIGGLEPARELVMQAIANGKHVVTANKHLVAKHGNEIFAAAQAKGVMVAFEAAVAGGIPIIKALREGLTANRIEWLAGIINGTSNFILSEMRDKGAAFDDVLKQAQALGYAEADPTFDVEGIDAAHKLTILSAIAFGIPMQFDKAYTEGISKLTREDVKYAEELGYRIKLLGIARRAAAGIELRVHPTLIPARRLIANVDGAMNAVLVKGDAVGPTLYYGAGAVIQRRPDRVALHQHRVHRAVDVGDQPPCGNQRRVHAQLDAGRGAARDAEQLDAVAEFLGVFHILAGELRDALGISLVELHRYAEGDRRQDGELVRGIDALDVEGRIGLGVAQGLRLFQHVVERRPLVAHLAEDEVAGAVDDAGQPLDTVRGEALAQRLDDGNAARHRRLERDHHALGLRRGEDFVAVLGDQVLVGGDHVLAVGDRLHH